MNWTGITQIRNHLYRLNVGDGAVRGYSTRLLSGEYANLPHSHITAGSETVKAVTDTIPSSETVQPASGPVALKNSHPVPDTVVCAADSSLSTLFQENLDYIVDYSAGTILRLDSGAIPADSSVIVWCLSYHVYQAGIDYDIDYNRGRLKRIASGSIEDNQEVLIDYALGSSEFSDDEIEQCITEAEAEIARVIDPEYLQSTDPALQSAVTFLTLSLLCRNSAGMTATGLAGTDSSASIWLDLAQSYQETAERLLTWFRRRMPDMKPPRRV